MTERFSPPAPLSASHAVDDFHSGEPVLDAWLRDRALDNMTIGASRTFVVTPVGAQRVVGFYALAMGQVLNQDVPGAMRRNMPRQIPAVILGRLAVDRSMQGQGLGAALLQDAVTRSLRAIAEVSARIMLVHAISPAAEAFYSHHGFTRLAVTPPTYALDLVKYAAI